MTAPDPRLGMADIIAEAARNSDAAHWPEAVEIALTAAGYGLVADAKAEALRDLTVNSPRLPSGVRNVVFEAVFDVIDKFNFPVQNCGPHRDVVEAGDVCGEVEKRIVAILRARAATLEARNE